MSDQHEHQGYTPADPEDIEALMAEARLDYNPTPQERWNSQVELAQALLQALPDAQVTSGSVRGRGAHVDYISPNPNPPLTVFGPDGRFIISFLADGKWIEADGRIAGMSGIIEGSPESLARQWIRIAGLELARDTRSRRGIPRRPIPSDGLRRQLQPRPTKSWRDTVELPPGQTWNEHTPASICRESQASRLIAVRYDQGSCTFARASLPRWGIESLRIPDFIPDPDHPTWKPPIDPIRVGDCILTVGQKFEADEDQLKFEHGFDGERMWFPQRVVHVEPEGAGHLRVWLALDNDVKNDNVTPGELTAPVELPSGQPRILTEQEAFTIWQHFQLDVFCSECGNRAKPIVYGMPTSADPSYLAIGGCVIERNQPRYTCYCGNAWTDVEELWA